MAQEEVEIVRRMLSAFNRGDIEAVIAAFDDRCELREPPEMPDSPPAGYRGHDGIREWMSNLRRTGEVSFEPSRLAMRGELIVSELVGRGVGESSGAPFEWKTFAVIEVSGGRIVSLRAYLTEREALAATRMSS